MRKAKHYALDLGAVTVCYYFAGWHGVVAFAVVWVAVVAAAAWLVLQIESYEEGSLGKFLAGRMGEVFDAINEFGAARDAGDVSTMPDDHLVVACAFYGSVSPNAPSSTSMRNAVEANRVLAIAEVERRGLDAKLKHAAAVVASARAGLHERMEAVGFAATAVKLLAMIAIACLGYADIGGFMHLLTLHRKG
jgi:hypothetical protein